MNQESTDHETTPAPSTGPQFSLLTLFYLMAVYAAGLTFGTWTVILTTLVLVSWWVPLKSKIRPRLIFFFLAILLIIIGMALPAVQTARESSVHTQCLIGVRQFMLAILNYESVHGTFPPAYETDDAGKPIHSWRVLILPFIEEQALYNRYRFDEPWDGPSNIKLLNQMPNIYACPMHRDHPDRTPYKLVVDEGTLFDGGQRRTFADIIDGASKTFGVIEDTRNPVPWTKPEDLTIQQAVDALSNQNPRHVAHILHRQFSTLLLGSSVAFMDGSSQMLGPKVSTADLRSCCLIADGRIVDIQNLGDSIKVVHYGRYVALAIYIILLLVPGFVRLRTYSFDKTSRPLTE